MKRLIEAVAIVLWLGTSAATAQTKLVLGYTSANTFIPAFVAKEEGFFAKRGLNIELQRIQVGSTIPAALLSDSLQIGCLTAPPVLLASEGGIALQIVAGASVQARSNPTTAVVARPEANIKVPADFRGKRVGVPGINGVNQVVFIRWLQLKGIDPKGVIFVEAAFPQMNDMLRGGTIDAALPVEPFLKRIQDAKVGALVANYTAEVTDSYLESFYVTTRKFAEANPAVVQAIRESIRDGLAFTEKNPEAARKTQVKYLGLPEALAATIPFPTFTVDVNVAQMQYWIDTMKQTGGLKGTVRAEEVVAK